MPKRPQILESIISETVKACDKGEPLTAIFDLDSTLYDVSPRITAIIHDFAKHPSYFQEYPEACESLLKVTPQSGDWGVKRTLERYNFIPPSQDFVKKLVDFWKTHFFSNTYLHHDIPYPGAKEYVDDLLNAGAEIVYLTGRDVARMKDGTVRSLKAHGFPLDNNHTNLHLKPKSHDDDALFKKEFFEKWNKEKGPVWFFENEPTNIHLVFNHSPHIQIVFVDTVHSGASPLPPNSIPKVEGFII